MIVLLRIAGLVMVGAISVLSLIPGQARPDIAWPFSLEHALAYLMAAILLCLGFRRPRVQAGGADDRRILSTVCALSAYGGLLELLQYVVPDRTPSLVDWSANTTGALVGALLMWLLRRLVSDGIRQAH